MPQKKRSLLAQKKRRYAATFQTVCIRERRQRLRALN
jgi:hypothetical protein